MEDACFQSGKNNSVRALIQLDVLMGEKILLSGEAAAVWIRWIKGLVWGLHGFNGTWRILKSNSEKVFFHSLFTEGKGDVHIATSFCQRRGEDGFHKTSWAIKRSPAVKVRSAWKFWAFTKVKIDMIMMDSGRAGSGWSKWECVCFMQWLKRQIWPAKYQR